MTEVSIYRIWADDWEKYRDVRLRALKDSPFAFGGTYENEVQQSEELWREKMHRAVLVAEINSKIVGLVVGKKNSEIENVVNLFSMWVDPEFRGRSVGTKLIEKFIEWAHMENATKIISGYAQDNTGAKQYYESLGFKETDEKVPLWRDPNVLEIVIEKEI